MKSRKRAYSIALCCLLAVTVLLPGLVFLFAGATAADDQEESLLGTLSAQFEASSPGMVSSGTGDLGGKSYGAYQFASRYDTPKAFFEWCLQQDDTYYRSVGERLQDAYYSGGAGYGTNFDNTWRALNNEDSAGFLRVQRNYVRLSYYEPIVAKLEANVPGFSADDYSIALRNVLWSRAAQHGTGGAYSVVTRAFAALGGFKNQPEAELIDAIYAESGRLTTDAATTMSGTTAERYGVSGQALAYYTGCSGEVQLGVYLRLRVNEPAKAQAMLAQYGYADAVIDEGVYRIQPSSNTNLSAVAGSTSVSLNGVADSDAQRFQLTYYASGYYAITCRDSGLRLAAASDGSVTMEKPAASESQMWRLACYNSGFSIQNRATGQYLAASSYAAGGRRQTAQSAYQWQVALAAGGWSLAGASYPTYASGLTEGASSYPFRGTLRCSYPISRVEVRILNAAGGDAITPAAASPGSKSFDLSSLDNSVAFSRLRAGGYTLVITAESGAPTDGTFRLESPFYVSGDGFTVTFDPCGGTCGEAKRAVYAGQCYGDLPTAAKDGWTFDGWYTAPEGGSRIDGADIVTAGDHTLYAHYSREYSYVFYNYDGTAVSSGRLAAGEEIPAPDQTPSRPSDGTYYYVFTGWSGYSAGMTISDNVSFTAAYEAHEIVGEPDQIITSAYVIRDGWLRRIPLGTTTAEVQSGLTPSSGITIHKGSAPATGLAGTGMTVEYTRGGEVVQTLTMVVTGDLNGDGRLDISDVVQLQGSLLNRVTLSDAAAQAADVNGDGRIDISDMVQMTAALLGRSSVKPN